MLAKQKPTARQHPHASIILNTAVHSTKELAMMIPHVLQQVRFLLFPESAMIARVPSNDVAISQMPLHRVESPVLLRALRARVNLSAELRMDVDHVQITMIPAREHQWTVVAGISSFRAAGLHVGHEPR